MRTRGKRAARTTRTTFGPMSILTGVISLGWAVLAALSIIGLPAPGGIVLGVIGAGGCAFTGWLAWSMRIDHDALGIVLPGRGRVSWESVYTLEIQSGLVSVPVITLREGRALDEVPLDGLGWFGPNNGLTRGLAEQLAHDGGLGDIIVRPLAARKGRRAA